MKNNIFACVWGFGFVWFDTLKSDKIETRNSWNFNENQWTSLKNNDLTLLTAKSTQATQIRYRQRSIISALRRRGLEVSSLKIKVQPIFSAKKPEDSERYLTPQNASQLQQTAAYIEDESLRNALIKLSKRTRGD